jgi:hypothetical protein
MTDRWAKPVVPLAVEEVGKSLVYGGHRWDFSQFVLEHDDVERIRLGYVCIHCLEPHEKPYVWRCSVCKFPIRYVQDKVFERFYEGEEKVGPSVTLAEEMEIAKEMVEREA